MCAIIILMYSSILLNNIMKRPQNLFILEVCNANPLYNSNLFA